MYVVGTRISVRRTEYNEYCDETGQETCPADVVKYFYVYDGKVFWTYDIQIARKHFSGHIIDLVQSPLFELYKEYGNPNELIFHKV